MHPSSDGSFTENKPITCLSDGGMILLPIMVWLLKFCKSASIDAMSSQPEILSTSGSIERFYSFHLEMSFEASRLAT